MTEPSIALAAINHGDDADTRRRVAMILSQEAAKGAAALPEGDILSAVIDARWTWSRKLGSESNITDGILRDQVHETWPPKSGDDE